MPIDHADPPDDADGPHPPDHAHQPDRAQPPGRPQPPGRAEPPDGSHPSSACPPSLDANDRAAAHRSYQAKVDQAYAAERTWAKAVPSLRAAWAKHQDQYPERTRATPQTHPDNSWSSGEARKLTPDQNSVVDRGYAGICEIGARDIVPRLLAAEAEDPSRHLAGFDRHIKGADRLKEKIADRVRTKGRPPDQALAEIPDVVRFTFQYSESAYASGVREDVKRLEGQGFIQVERRNTWNDDQYKGINSRWREPKSGTLFEVQFHTRASLEAKELTHHAYERIRSTAQDGERVELKEFQRRVNSMIPLPPGAAEIENYPLGDR
jgi:hypothetical protein